MTYTKPEIHVLGDASVVIEHVETNKTSNKVDSHNTASIPAYDLDE